MSSSSARGGQTSRNGIDYTVILPVLFLEYLSVSIAKSLIPTMIVDSFGSYSYLAVGCMETVKGLLAFVSSPLFGKLSDIIGRKYCLLATVIGTTLPVFMMVFTTNMYVYGAMLGVSGFFSATFTLTFAYISDCVDARKRAPAYGLALATFGLSFTVGPITGSLLAAQLGKKAVFFLSLLLAILDVLYIVFRLPESVQGLDSEAPSPYQKLGVAIEYLPNSWSFSETFKLFGADPFMRDLAVVVFMYYTAVWAIVSTLMVYITRHLLFTPVQLGWLLSAYGLATMFSEGVLVRIAVPRLGELGCMRLGLAAFAVQCALVATSSSPAWIFVSVLFSTGANLFYPSVSSLVSKIVDERQQGEAQGALNGIKALTEGFGPLLFGALMGLFEHSPQPGAPFLLASVLSLWAFLHCAELPAPGSLQAIKVRAAGAASEETEGLLEERREWEEAQRSRRKRQTHGNGLGRNSPGGNGLGETPPTVEEGH
mmetsp:Transcript_7387/g.16192  ORF Transcript_7387/g.16192 Transcript_7387/m.16192 type:complete len:483 (+) Transcript_7387:115-1563(+)|eukprot:CAMPEP_0173186200 /NCGR_PEP_ID=MMETSP1141-20130122/9998_1 /TAXON_ID=483371 /ORGANISM="non described non described, Strain CCMP2298" /LENGTH=482 /DNA_ID=CAMNT_0014109853 /DNA_START=91 /DNA_END=1539 /DNA_ORIENTATION=+